MKIYYFMCLLALIFVSCDGEEDQAELNFGSFDLKFDQIVGTRSVAILSEVLSEEYPYTNELGQSFNLTTFRYILSEIVFEGPNGEYHADELLVATDEIKGYYLVDETDFDSQRLTIENIPNGTYNKVSFTLGVEELGVEQGTGIFLSGMFWTWNNGYIALKIEGQSPDSPGEAFGDSIEESNPNGFAYHIGGWSDPNNNRRFTLEFEPLMVEPSFLPEAHIAVDAKRIFSGVNPVDFAVQNSVHTPAEGSLIADNLTDLFEIDHVHQ